MTATVAARDEGGYVELAGNCWGSGKSLGGEIDDCRTAVQRGSENKCLPVLGHVSFPY